MNNTAEAPAIDKSKYFKHPEFGYVKANDAMRTPKGTLVWVKIIKPVPGKKDEKTGEEKPGRYECSLLLDKNNPDLAAFISELKAETAGMINFYNEGKKAKISTDIELFGDGDTLDHEKYPFGKGMWIVQGRKMEDKDAPGIRKFEIRGPDKNLVPPEYVQGGMEGRFVFTPLITAHGLSYQIDIIQVTADSGKRIGGKGADKLSLLDDDVPETNGNGEETPEPTPEPSLPEAAKAVAAPKGGKGVSKAVNLL